MAARPDATERDVIRVLSRLAEAGPTFPDTQKQWTTQILTRLARLGRRTGCTPYTSKRDGKLDADAGEWLYDLAWLRYDPQRYIRAIPLVLESELGPDANDRLEDFCKLLVARGDHRVMVFGAANPAAADRIIDEFIDEIEHCGLTTRGDRYLLAGLLESDWKFVFRCHRAGSNGSITRAALRSRAAKGPSRRFGAGQPARQRPR